jgi:hypothetical protein
VVQRRPQSCAQRTPGVTIIRGFAGTHAFLFRKFVLSMTVMSPKFSMDPRSSGNFWQVRLQSGRVFTITGHRPKRITMHISIAGRAYPTDRP